MDRCRGNIREFVKAFLVRYSEVGRDSSMCSSKSVTKSHKSELWIQGFLWMCRFRKPRGEGSQPWIGAGMIEVEVEEQ